MPRITKNDKSLFVTISNNLSELESLLDVVERFGKSSNLATEGLFSARLALEELITNLLKYGYRDNGERFISIGIQLSDDCLTIRIENDADSFNPLENREDARNRAIKEKARGGHGLLLIQTLMDDLNYQRQNERNILTLRKKIVS